MDRKQVFGNQGAEVGLTLLIIAPSKSPGEPIYPHNLRLFWNRKFGSLQIIHL